MKLAYVTKVRIVKYLLPALVIVPCAAAGYHATRSLFAQSVPPLQGVGVSTNRQKYHVGQQVTVILTNNSSAKYFINNNCPNEPLAVYRDVNNKWIPVHARTSIANCHGLPSSYEIPPHSSIITDYRHWQSLFVQPGIYRIVMNVQFYSNGPSTEFLVEK